MRQKSGIQKPPAERIVRDIRRRTRKQHSAKQKIRIVLEGLRGEESIAEAALRPTMRFVAGKSAETQARAVALRTHQGLVRSARS